MGSRKVSTEIKAKVHFSGRGIVTRRLHHFQMMINCKKKEKNMHIAIEGIDGVGKTTLAKNLAEKIGFQCIEKHLHALLDGEDMEQIPQYLKVTQYINHSEDALLRAWFYALGNIYMKEHYKSTDIVTDRYFASNYSWNGNTENEFIFDFLIRKLGKPQITFLLYADENARKNRILKRNSADPDLANFHGDFSLRMYHKLDSFLKRYDFNYFPLDTSNCSGEETLALVMQILQREFPDRFA